MYPLQILLLALLSSGHEASNILGILPMGSRSHNAVFERLVDGLHSRGHRVTVVSYFAPKTKYANYTHVNAAGKIVDIVNAFPIKMEHVRSDLTSHFRALRSLEGRACHGLLSADEVRKLYATERRTFDLLLVESYYLHCFLPIAAKHATPVVQFYCPGRLFYADYATASADNPAVVPVVVRRTYAFAVSAPAAFAARLQNFANYLLHYYYHYVWFKPDTERICRRYFGGDVDCDFDSLLKRVSLVFTNGHPVLFPRPLSPNHVEIGGIHLEPVKKLPQDLRDFIDESVHGVIYVSFGSSIKISDSEERFLDTLVKTFSSLPQRIIWKYERGGNTTIELDNALIREWLPQRDILAHSNVKAFITHGGLMSIYEAIDQGTPVIGIPMFFDQHDNILRLEELEVGLYLDVENLTVDQTTKAIKTVLEDNKYRNNMLELSRKFNDNPKSPLDKAVFWMEYVMRHNGAQHIRSVAADMPLYQYLLIDVIVCSIGFVVFVVVVAVMLFQMIKYFAKSRKRKIA